MLVPSEPRTTVISSPPPPLKLLEAIRIISLPICIYEPSGKRFIIDVAVVDPSGSFTLNATSPVLIASFRINVS